MYKLHLLYLTVFKFKNRFPLIHYNSKSTISNKTEQSSERIVRVASPGRINLIGEHTDYNHGFVMPTAIDKITHLELQKNGNTHRCSVFSATFDTGFKFDLNNLKKSQHTWENYILGVVNELLKLGKTIKGFNCKITSNLPIGAGISSSAALECGLASGLNELFDLGLTRLQIAELAQAAENNFVGSQCGIMDQFASVMSKKDHLILLDCLTLEAEFIPVNFKSCKILLVNTKVSHNLSEGEYNDRRKECEQALEILKGKNSDIKSLRDVTAQHLESYKDSLSTKQYNRVKYVLEENARVLKSTGHIKNGELKDFGELMYRSHEGLKSLFEVSCKELDFLVEYTKDKNYIYGSRMMGGGFGGCTINLIEADAIADFVKEVTLAYDSEFNITPDTITVVPSEGTIIN